MFILNFIKIHQLVSNVVYVRGRTRTYRRRCYYKPLLSHIYLFIYLFSRLYNVSISSCAHL